MKAPDKIYLGIDELDSGYVYNLSLENNGHAEYIRKDLVEHIIRRALGPQDALNKIRSL